MKNIKFGFLIVPLVFLFAGMHPASAQAANLIPNPSVETAASASAPTSWATDLWGTTKATFTYPTGGAEDGSRYVKTQITTTGTGDAKWYPNHITGVSGQTYTFSDWYISNVASTVEVEVLLTSGSYTYLSLGSPAVSSTWKEFTKSFTLPANTKTFTVFHYIRAVGALSVDNYSVTTGTTPPPAFAFSMSNAGNRTLVQGASTSTTVTATLTSGTTKAVNFSATNLPSGVTATFGTPSCSPTCSTSLTFAASASAATGTKAVTIVGSAGGTATSTTAFNLSVVAPGTPPPPAFNFTLANAGNRTLVQGASTSTTVTATLGSGTTQAVTFAAVSGLPSGVSASFSQNSCSPTCSTTLTLTANSTATVGTTTVTISATAGSLVKTTAFQLVVKTTTTPPPPPPTNLIANPSVETVNSGNTALPASWTHDVWGTNTTAFTYLSNLGHTGTHSVRVKISSYTDGDAKWMPATLAVTPGDSYRLTDWYQSTVENYPVIDFALADGTDYFLGLRPQDPAATWTQFSESFQVPANAKTMTVMHLINSVGTLTLDDMSITKITPKPLNRAIVSLNFDDGWEDDTISAFPVLKNLGFKGTWFFATTYIENSPATGPINVSGPSAIHALFNDGQEVGGHSVTHPDLTTLSQTDLDYELNHSKQYLESLIGAGNVKNLATPFGTYSDQVIATAKPLYNSLRSTDEGFNTPDDFDQYRLEVQNMQKTTTLAQFKSWIDQAKKDKSWLILIYHRVATSSLEDFDTPVADFSPQMNYVKQSGISVETTQQALSEILPQLGL
jgi:peptidoglycan/xylan/chitin deacetylase (PgdA/CDA1 family)